ncbi:MAG: hypothetical protein VB085_02025 [Peptococcaceae bacterium]|nr:hypothetical protein [Peptococcaceae bacterium]
MMKDAAVIPGSGDHGYRAAGGRFVLTAQQCGYCLQVPRRRRPVGCRRRCRFQD